MMAEVRHRCGHRARYDLRGPGEAVEAQMRRLADLPCPRCRNGNGGRNGGRNRNGNGPGRDAPSRPQAPRVQVPRPALPRRGPAFPHWRETPDGGLSPMAGEEVRARVEPGEGGYRVRESRREAMAAAGEAVGIPHADTLPVLPAVVRPVRAWCPRCRRAWLRDPRSGLPLGASPGATDPPEGAQEAVCALCEVLEERRA